MMKQNFTRHCVCVLALAVCLSGAAYAQTAPRSYYVRADGDDNNNGRSEAAPFKTLEKAAEMAKMGVIKTITVIGPLEGGSVQAAGNDEILITGKPDAGDAEKAVINKTVSISDAKVRFTHIRFEGRMSISGTVTLGEGVVVTGSSSDGLVSWWDGSLTMTGDAHITGNTKGPGISGDDRGTVIMNGNAKITGNAGAGIYNVRVVTMSDKAEISGNKGRGITGAAGASGASTITLSGNASITGNTAERGGGVYVGYRGTLTLSGNASITGNTAKQGGGVYVKTGQASMEGGTISGNKAEYGAGVYVPKDRIFTLKKGTITGNEAEFVGGGVYVEAGGTYNAQGGSVTGNTAGDGDGENVFRQR
ncbi:MAG: hypothetical protein LBQ88_17600 [Treponema sp.]|jgi:hypothetical protein|nr:hypothetical protein [Treponema sp.]